MCDVRLKQLLFCLNLLHELNSLNLFISISQTACDNPNVCHVVHEKYVHLTVNGISFSRGDIATFWAVGLAFLREN